MLLKPSGQPQVFLIDHHYSGIFPFYLWDFFFLPSV